VYVTERFYDMKQCPGTYFVIVIEDVDKCQVVGSATLVVEQKFIHNAAIVSYCKVTLMSFSCNHFTFTCSHELHVIMLSCNWTCVMS